LGTEKSKNQTVKRKHKNLQGSMSVHSIRSRDKAAIDPWHLG